MKRIRYIKQLDGSLLSMQTLKGSIAEYKSVVHPDGKGGEVIDATTGDVMASVSGSSSHKTKIALKKELEHLGVEFVTEGRVVRGKTTSVSNS